MYSESDHVIITSQSVSEIPACQNHDLTRLQIVKCEDSLPN